MPAYATTPVSAPATANLADLLRVGALRCVVDVAAAELGHSITTRTVLRWVVNGRSGVALPVVRGVRGKLMTTADCFREWFMRTGAVGPVATVAAPQAGPDAAADALLEALSPKLGRKRGA